MKIALAQINSTIGDFSQNVEKILHGVLRAEAEGVDLVVFPECTLTGYPPEDLVLRPSFLEANEAAIRDILARMPKNVYAIVGSLWRNKKGVANAAYLLSSRKIVDVYAKKCLPNYGVFDEKRYFVAGERPGIFTIHGRKIGISICEDIWEENLKISPVAESAKKGAECLINISASPYHRRKIVTRKKLVSSRARKFKKPVLYLNAVGGQDELVFDGASLVYSEKARCVGQGRMFHEDWICVELQKGKITLPAPHLEPELENVEEVYQALVLGTRDYVEKNGFKRVAFGLSGGIDSALVASIAVDALGTSRVRALTMPSRYSSSGTLNDALAIGRNMGFPVETIAIENLFRAYSDALQPYFKNFPTDLTEENLQSRIRGVLLMAWSNKFGDLILTTGNKSETSVGYSTLYGDTAGGFAVIKDVPKTLVYELSCWRNERAASEWIPQSVIDRAPSAELRDNQKDQDSLPPYDLLDAIIQDLIEREVPKKVLLQRYPREVVEKVLRLIRFSEYKRRQSPLGIKITPRAFGRDHRMPIAHRFSF